MRRVRLVKRLAVPGGPLYVIGQGAAFEDALADEWIAAGIAEPDDVEPEAVPAEPVSGKAWRRPPRDKIIREGATKSG